MAKTQIRGQQILDGSIKRKDLNVDNATNAVIRKVIAGTNITIDYTGAAEGTGDVTINAAEVEAVEIPFSYTTVTEDDTPTALQIFTLDNDTTYTVELSLTARMYSTTAKGIGGKLKCVVYRNNSGSATLANDFGGALKEIESYGSSNFDFDIDLSGNNFRILLTGDDTDPVAWSISGKIISAPAGQKAVGGTITEVEIGMDLYNIHTFSDVGSNNFSVLGNDLDVEYLVVGGGGGGGVYGGGGAGGLLTNVGGTPLTLTPGIYSITVGAGGAGAATVSTRGASGGNSSIAALVIATGGGGGGSAGPGYDNSLIAGLSGGAGGGGSSVNGAGGTGTAGQGYAGGTANNNTGSGGGGGSSAVGSNAASTVSGGNGGNGTSNSILGSANTYAGGGGGGARNDGTAGIGGSGGGGNGSNNHSTPGSAGLVNTGSGGGGGGRTTAVADSAGGNGGSGIVIIRYLK